MDLNVHVGPEAQDVIVDAVVSAGARISAPEDASALIWSGGKPAELASYLHPGMEWVQLPSAGIESYVDVGVIDGNRVFTSAVGAYSFAVAEHSLALMLAASRRLHELARTRTWSRTQVESATLRHARVVIVGAGGIGEGLIALLQPFEPTIVAITLSGRQVPGAEVSTTPARLLDVLPDADYVVVAAPATSETRALIGQRELSAMPESAWLVNISRGSLVDTDALLAVLRAGDIAGAALDVTDPEPLPDGHPLWDEPNVLITPHSSNPHSLSLPRYAERVGNNVRHFMRGEPMEGVVDVSNGY